MSTSAERLEEIDRELEAFGKSNDELAEVAARAVALARELGDADGELAGLLEGQEEALAAAREAARARALEASRAAAPARPLPEVKRRPPKPRPEPEVRADELPVDPTPLAGSATRVELPPSAPLKPVADSEAQALDAEIDDVFGSEPPPLETSDIAGMSVDELFADADPSPSSDPQELSSLFDDEEEEAAAEPLRLSDPDLSLSEMEAEVAPAETDAEPEEPAAAAAAPSAPPASAPPASAPPASAVPPPPPKSAVPPPPPPSSRPPAIEDFPKFGEEDDATQIVSAEEFEVLDEDDFELLVDEDVLEFDENESETEPGDPSEGDEEKAEGGLISRILGRK